MNGWISVKDRLPNNAEYVIIYSARGCFKYAIAWYSSGGKWIKDDHEFVGVVTHWMPLPEKPKGM